MNHEPMTHEELEFFDSALLRVNEDENWISFGDWAFDRDHSPIYKRKSPSGILMSALYLRLIDLWIMLGKRQNWKAPASNL